MMGLGNREEEKKKMRHMNVGLMMYVSVCIYDMMYVYVCIYDMMYVYVWVCVCVCMCMYVYP